MAKEAWGSGLVHPRRGGLRLPELPGRRGRFKINWRRWWSRHAWSLRRFSAKSEYQSMAKQRGYVVQSKDEKLKAVKRQRPIVRSVGREAIGTKTVSARRTRIRELSSHTQHMSGRLLHGEGCGAQRRLLWNHGLRVCEDLGRTHLV